jgi:hypothetical protein
VATSHEIAVSTPKAGICPPQADAEESVHVEDVEHRAKKII